MASVEYGDKTNALKEALKRNIYPFSVAKSFTQMLYYRKSMVNERGEIRSYDNFVKHIADSGEVFNSTFLRTEYEHAYYSTIMADKWDRFADDDILEYSTVGDSFVRPSHKALDKYTAPKLDSFWKNNYPPNGWNCRCTVIPGKANRQNRLTPQEAGRQLKEENKNSPFYSNVGISKIIFDGKHPYFINLNDKKVYLSWEQYGLPSVEKIYTDEKPKFIKTNKEEYLDWWKTQKKSENDDIKVKDVLNNDIILDSPEGKKKNKNNYFKEHILKKSDQNRFEFATESINVLKNPDEVWDNPSQGRVYIKYYENGIIKIAVNNNIATTIFKLYEKNSGELSSARKGLLLYK